MVPRSHIFLTAAVNALNQACHEMEQAAFADTDRPDPDIKKLRVAVCRTRERVYAKWNKNIKRGCREGWWK